MPYCPAGYPAPAVGATFHPVSPFALMVHRIHSMNFEVSIDELLSRSIEAISEKAENLVRINLKSWSAILFVQTS